MSMLVNICSPKQTSLHSVGPNDSAQKKECTEQSSVVWATITYSKTYFLTVMNTLIPNLEEAANVAAEFIYSESQISLSHMPGH